MVTEMAFGEGLRPSNKYVSGSMDDGRSALTWMSRIPFRNGRWVRMRVRGLLVRMMHGLLKR